MPKLYKLFQKIKLYFYFEKKFPTHSSITLISEPNKNITRTLQTIVSYEYINKNSQQNTSKPNPNVYREL